MKRVIRNIALFYYNGFKHMPLWGKKMWLIIIIKLLIMFLLLKLFFFPNFLNSNFDSDEEKGNHVLKELTK